MKLVNFLISKAFKERLKNIKSPITDEILKIKKVDFESNSYRNYISVSNDDKTMISFVDRNKENKINEVLLELKYEDWDFYNLNEGDEIKLNPFAFSHYKNENGEWEKGYNYIRFPYFNQKLNYKIKSVGYFGLTLDNHLNTIIKNKNAIEIPNSIKKIPLNFNKEIWNPEKRIKTKAGKFIRTLFENKFSDREIEHWVNEYQKQAISEAGENGLFKEIEGESIRWAYYENNYKNDRGSLGGSCMRYNECQKYLDIYCKNTNKVGLLIITEDNKIKARCILWYPEGKQSNIKYHDRVYFSSNEDKQLMEIYLKANNFEDIYNDKNYRDVNFELDYIDFNYYPYMDTMKYIKNNSLYSINHNCEKEITNTNGSYNDLNENTVCDYCSAYCDEDDLIYISYGRSRGEYLCEDCRTYCDDINYYVHSDDAVWSEYSQMDYFIDNVKYSEHLQSYIHKDDAIELYDGNYTHEDESYVVTVNNEYVLIDDEGLVEIENEYYLVNDENIYFNEETQEWDLITNKKEENEMV